MKNLKIYYHQVQHEDIHRQLNQIGCQITQKMNEAGLVWTKPQKPQYFKNIKSSQYCNQFPGVELFDDKINLTTQLMKAKVDYIPRTWIFRNDIPAFRKQKEDNNYYILKPTNQACGREIMIFQGSQVQSNEATNESFQDVLENVYPSVCQEYLLHPLLLNGKKFDFRFYVLITSQHLYVYKQYLLRICELPYSLNNLNTKAHITNTTINHIKMSSQQWKQNSQINNIYDEEKLINDVQYIVKDVYQCISSQIVSKHGQFQENLFTILGFDILLARTHQDNDIKQIYKPFLLEVNKSPSLLIQSEADEDIKPCLLKDTIKLIINNEIGQYIQII